MQNPKFICVLDFEATTEENVKFFDHEVIEFPSVLLKLNSNNEYECVSSFQKFCRPLLNPVVSKFCHELTGITQEQVDSGINFINALNDHKKWLYTETSGNVVIVTCGFWDLSKMMVAECKKWNVVPDKIYMHYINIKKEFEKFYKTNAVSMTSMLDFLNIKLEGRHHSGIDDCGNIAKIWQRLAADGYLVSDSSYIKVESESYKISHPNSKKELENKKLREQRTIKN
ncbi:MAG: exonuclease [Satyrvirus sp.]|uniref:Exonuclease n=1 Tax=Satyrvirus sp. TaxID=2487771 RepID=A0A3G5AGY3_9VIRU|nr:MAG: exonuclease [Satyrvirus sp.]